MNTRCAIPPFVMCCLAAAATAQTSWIVDSLNAAGAHFTDIPAAVAAAASGDRIVVRGRGTTPGTTYTAPTIDGKSLTFVREGTLPALVFNIWNISNLTAEQSVVLSGLQPGRPGGGANINGTNIRGLLMLDRLTADMGCRFTDCDLVVIARSDIWSRPFATAGIAMTRSRLVVLSSFIRGVVSDPWGSPLGAIGLDSSTAWFVGSQIEGPWGTFSVPNMYGPGIDTQNSEIFLGPSTVIVGGQAFGGGLRHLAIQDPGPNPTPTSILHHDPTDTSIVLDTFPFFTYPAGPVASLVMTEMPATLLLSQRAVPTSVTLLAAGGLQTAPWPSPFGPAFLDPNQILFAELRVAPANGQVSRSFAIPAGLAPGFRLAFQAAELSTTNVLSTTNPLVFGVW